MLVNSKILFVYGGLPLGGIETLIVRLSRQLKPKNDVYVLLLTRNYDDQLLSRLREYASVKFLDELLVAFPHKIYKSPLLYAWRTFCYDKLYIWMKGPVNFTHAPDINSYLFTLKLIPSRLLGKITVGVYHDREYLFPNNSIHYLIRKSYELLKLTPQQNIIFCNERSISEANKIYCKKYENSSVVPVGVELPQRFDSNQIFFGEIHQQTNLIVSIGRLTKFKTYNVQMVYAIKILKELGYNFEYHIWGDGECRRDIDTLIKKLGLTSNVFLHGNLNYQDFTKVLEGAFAFVGSGTAIIESAAFGIPSIIGIEDENSERTYGFFHDVTGWAYHDKGLGFPTKSYVDCILYLANLNSIQYKQECEKSIKRASEFSIVNTSSLFLKACSNAIDIGEFKISFFRTSISFLIIKILSFFFKSAWFGRHSVH